MSEGIVMENSAMIWALKEKIKDLAEIQIQTKRARKTSLPKADWLALKNILAPKKAYWDHNSAAADARLRKDEITACLNYYHELRGSTYRHGKTNDGLPTDSCARNYWYDKYMKELKAELSKIK